MADPSVELQTAIYERLLGDETVAEIVNGAILDGYPAEPRRPDQTAAPAPVPSVTFGPSDYTLDVFDGPGDEGDEAITTRSEAVTLHAWRGENGLLWPVKELTGAIVKAIRSAPLELETHAITEIRISAVRHMLDPDGLTGHGVVTVEAEIEERG